MKTTMIIMLAVLFSLAGCQRYQTFLLYDATESHQEEHRESKEVMDEEISNENEFEVRQRVLVDRKTGRLYYFSDQHRLQVVDPD